MNIPVFIGLALIFLAVLVLSAGFAARNMMSVFRSLPDASRDRSPSAFWVLTGLYLAFAGLGVAIAIESWSDGS